MADPTVDPEELARKRARNREKSRRYRALHRKALNAKKRARYVNDPARMKEADSRWRAKNRGKAAAATRAWRIANPERAKALDQNRDPAVTAAQRKRWRERNKEKIKASKRANRVRHNEQQKARYHAKTAPDRSSLNEKNRERYERAYRHDPDWRIKNVLRSRLRKALRKMYRMSSAVRDLGCTLEEFRQHIEAQFLPGMTWDNWGVKGWHLDHIKPLALFSLTDPDQLRTAIHFTNYQPLWAADNLRKGARPGPLQTNQQSEQLP